MGSFSGLDAASGCRVRTPISLCHWLCHGLIIPFYCLFPCPFPHAPSVGLYFHIGIKKYFYILKGKNTTGVKTIFVFAVSSPFISANILSLNSLLSLSFKIPSKLFL